MIQYETVGQGSEDQVVHQTHPASTEGGDNIGFVDPETTLTLALMEAELAEVYARTQAVTHPHEHARVKPAAER